MVQCGLESFFVVGSRPAFAQRGFNPAWIVIQPSRLLPLLQGEVERITPLAVDQPSGDIPAIFQEELARQLCEFGFVVWQIDGFELLAINTGPNTVGMATPVFLVEYDSSRLIGELEVLPDAIYGVFKGFG